jgi:2-polyprenyl-6-hydroxyphenyl methylase/3-demethylubiquinone-9 3-methyltransferase
VYVSATGFHYIDYLDPVDHINPEISSAPLGPDEIAYIEQQLQSNAERFEHQVRVVKRFVEPTGKTVLDIGCGGGLFLTKMRQAGAHVTGIELSDTRSAYAMRRHGLDIVKRPVEDAYWQDRARTFNIVTLWDVIEHVNFPAATLRAAVGLLKPGGHLLIDTPCRDAFYHRVGELTYRLSGGRMPTFLDAMYSEHPFGHKQIFATREMRDLFESSGLEVLELKKFHELSFPRAFYLRKLLKSEALVRLSDPAVSLVLAVFPVRNKMLIVGRKVQAVSA